MGNLGDSSFWRLPIVVLIIQVLDRHICTRPGHGFRAISCFLQFFLAFSAANRLSPRFLRQLLDSCTVFVDNTSP
jgi:hypothetical protein